MPEVTCGPFPWPMADEQVLAALEKAYHDGSWGVYHGPDCEALAEELSEYFGREHVQLCSSGTIGVELALRGCGVETGDEVILAGYDFPGNFRAVDAIGARPVLVDVAPDTWCIDVESLEEVSGEKVKAVVVSHLHGGLADIQRVIAVARQRGWHVVEDACQQPGAQLDGRTVGGWGDVSVLSFGGSKLLTAGRGGAVLTDDDAILQRIKVFSEQGNQAFPLSELQAAVLRPQLVQLDARNAIRKDRISTLREATHELAPWLRPVACRAGSQPTYYKHAWSFVPAESQPELRQQLLEMLHASGAPIDAGFRGFAGRGKRRCEKPVPLGVSEMLSQSTVLLHHPMLLAHKKAAHQVAEVLIHAVQQLVR
jgi:perosamine synthetase